MRKLLFSFFVAVLFALPASATWSIVVVNRRTGEVAIGSATCLEQIDLTDGLPTLRVGKGAGVIQALSGGESGLVIIFDELQIGTPPAVILKLVKAADLMPQSRQIGIVGMTGAPVTFTGRMASIAKGGVTGEVGDLAYAIQGNVLTGSEVWLAAEDALLNTVGDMSQKLMAAMEAARDLGGDGRCSCSISRPTSCGAPPPSFTKSAHCGFMIVARIGDKDGTCTTGRRCVSGKYYMRLNVKDANAQSTDPDPVDQLRVLYDGWRKVKIRQPDGLLSTASSVQSLPADGVTQRTVTVRLSNVEGSPLTKGGRNVRVLRVGGFPSFATVGPVTDLGDGTYSFSLTAGTVPGTDTFVIRADSATLYPYLTVRTDPVQVLHVGYDEVSAAQSPRVPFVVNAPRFANGSYLIVASLTGTKPGAVLGDFLIPLNPPLISVLNAAVDEARLPGTHGRLDAMGRAEGAFVPGPALMAPLIGSRIDWAAVVFGADGRLSGNAAGFDVVP